MTRSMVKKIGRIPKAVKKLYKKDFYHEPGTMPGTIIVDENADYPTIYLIDYQPNNFIRKQLETPEE